MSDRLKQFFGNVKKDFGSTYASNTAVDEDEEEKKRKKLEALRKLKARKESEATPAMQQFFNNVKKDIN
jgi:hypothetical protein